MKKFIRQLVADIKFSDVGEGRRLDSDTTPSTSSVSNAPVPRRPPTQDARTAGAAALARMEASNNKMNPTMRAQKEQMRREVVKSAGRPAPAPVVQREPEVISQMGLRLLCPLCSASFTKQAVYEHIEQCLVTQLDLEPLKTTCIMIHAMNKDPELLNTGVNTLVRYVENLINNPEDEKFKKIRVQNKAFQARIVPLVGGVEYLELVGYTLITDEGDSSEQYYIMLDTPPIEHMTRCNDELKKGSKLTPTLDRDIKVLQQATGARHFEVSSDFYKLTKEDLMKSQKDREREVQQNSQLRTSAMRERDAGVGMRIYHYTVIRIKFPDGIYLQGTFSAHDNVENLFLFVEKAMRHTIKFSLITAGCPPLRRDRSTLKVAGLVPTATLNLTTAERAEYTLLNDEMVCRISES